MAKTLYDKIWDAHLVQEKPGETPILYIDRHLIHEVTSPQAFEGLRNTGRKVRRPELTLAVADHNVPTKDRDQGITDPESREQVATLARNTAEFGVEYFTMDDERAGIVHIIGPEQGWTLPGNTIVCGDSHTSTHGAFGALAFGIGTSDVEHVLATQTLLMPKSKNMRINVSGKLPEGVTAKDIALAVIAKIGTAGGTGYVIEYAGDAVRALSMEGRMTLCNLTIEGGARAGLIAPDDHRGLTAHLTGGVHARDQALGGGLLVTGGTIDLAGEEEIFDFLGLERREELGGRSEVVFHRIRRPHHHGLFQSRNGMEHLQLDLEGQGGRKTVDVPFVRVSALRL